jgi:hypothetical protein
MQHRGGEGSVGQFWPPGQVGGGGPRRLLWSLAITGAGDEDRHEGDGNGAGASSTRSLDSLALTVIPVAVVDTGTGNEGD